MIVNAKNPTCASCRSFPADAIAVDASGTCATFDKPTDHSYPACVLYEQATDRAHRRSLVEQLKAK